MSKTWAAMLAGLFTMTLSSMGTVIFEDDFDQQGAMEGNPDGWAMFGTPLESRGIFTGDSVSSSNAMFIAVNWGLGGWGVVGLTSSSSYDLQDVDTATITAYLRATNAFSAPSVAFTLYDSDGTQWRTPDAQLYQPNATWQSYTWTITNAFVEAAGTTPGLDIHNITQFAVLSYTAGQTGQNQLRVDDFSVQYGTVPEPATMLLLGLALPLMAYQFRRRKHTSG